jgi:hypothetical protein
MQLMERRTHLSFPDFYSAAGKSSTTILSVKVETDSALAPK